MTALTPDQQRVSQAYYDGAMAAIGVVPWGEAADFFALVGDGYAAGRPLPSTMPSQAHRACVEGIVERLKRAEVALSQVSTLAAEAGGPAKPFGREIIAAIAAALCADRGA